MYNVTYSSSTRSKKALWLGVVSAVVLVGVLWAMPLCACSKSQGGIAWNDTKNLEHVYGEQGNETCPSSAQELLTTAGKRSSAKDPWGQEYQVTCPGEHDTKIDICSNGPDKQPKTEDDICSWKPQPRS